MPDPTASLPPEDSASGDFWVFAYGSLIWRPGFAFEEARTARVFGYRRALCIYSVVYRGTPAVPGLVLGLDRGGACRGRAYRVAPADWTDVLAYLGRREMVTGVYLPRRLIAHLDDGRRVRAYGFVAKADHAQYAGGLAEAEILAILRRARGREGPARDYLANTVRHLEALGIRDRTLGRLLKRI